jgi:hypothetical protein
MWLRHVWRGYVGMDGPLQRGQGPQGGRGGFSGNARGARRDDSLVGCVQKVKKGPWKGYRGKVRARVPLPVPPPEVLESLVLDAHAAVEVGVWASREVPEPKAAGEVRCSGVFSSCRLCHLPCSVPTQ